MRILHVMDSGGMYGAEVLVLGLMEAQSRSGDEPILASLGTPGNRQKSVEVEAAARGLQVEAVRFFPGPNPFGAARILRLAGRFEAGVIHAHGYKGDILLGLVPRRKRPAPVVATVHGWTAAGRRSKLAVYEWLDAKVLPRLDAVAVVHEGMLSHPRLAGRIPDLMCIENALPPDRGFASPASDDPTVQFTKGAFVVGTVGRLSSEKGIDVLVRAFATVRPHGDDGRPVRLLVVGDGPERRALEATARNLGLEDRVRFAGYRADARRVLEAFSLFVLPSYTEGLPMTVLEAMDAGIPVVASAVGGVPTALDGGRAGYLVEPGRADQLSLAIERVQRDETNSRAVAAAARARVRDRYSMDRCARKYGELYRRAIEARSRGGARP